MVTYIGSQAGCLSVVLLSSIIEAGLPERAHKHCELLHPVAEVYCWPSNQGPFVDQLYCHGKTEPNRDIKLPDFTIFEQRKVPLFLRS